MSNQLILEYLQNITLKLDVIEEHLNIVKSDCSRVRDHAIFVENTYSAVRTPMYFMKTKIEQIMGMEPSPQLLPPPSIRN